MGVYSELRRFTIAHRGCGELRGDAARSRPRATASGLTARAAHASSGGSRRRMPKA
jgi:hypothetical protein